MEADRLHQQIHFIVEIDRLKSVLRRTYLVHAARRENSAEHSWHVAIAALLLAEYANERIDVLRVVKMLLIHDIVEIEAGDTFVYDEAALVDQAERERQAADQIFSRLPEDQAKELRALWEEFDAGTTPEAKFAVALDRLLPLLHNYHTQGKSWQEHGITSDRVIAYNARIHEGSARLWQFARALIEDAVAKGHLAPPPERGVLLDAEREGE